MAAAASSAAFRFGLSTSDAITSATPSAFALGCDGPSILVGRMVAVGSAVKAWCVALKLAPWYMDSSLFLADRIRSIVLAVDAATSETDLNGVLHTARISRKRFQ
jgi:hypothetical protein